MAEDDTTKVQKYRIWIIFNGGNRYYNGKSMVFCSDEEALQWTQNCASYYVEQGYYWCTFAEYSIVNARTGRQYRGNMVDTSMN